MLWIIYFPLFAQRLPLYIKLKATTHSNSDDILHDAFFECISDIDKQRLYEPHLTLLRNKNLLTGDEFYRIQAEEHHLKVLGRKLICRENDEISIVIEFVCKTRHIQQSSSEKIRFYIFLSMLFNGKLNFHGCMEMGCS